MREFLVAFAVADADWADDLVGKTLADRYAVEGLIGSGGMGVVLAATHKRLERPVAIKMLHPMLARDTTIVKRFHQEAQAAASVGSAGVVEVIDLDDDPEHGPFLVMERLRGESYVEVLKRGRVPMDRALWITCELLDVLSAVHAKGIVHRDLKPPNVFLHQDESGDEIVKVVDFGIAKVSQRHLTMTGQIIGTPRFMSPEQANGEELDHRTDIYATGLLLYCALTGLPPYATAAESELIQRVVEGPPSLRTLRPDLPEALLAVVDKALAKAPKDRFQNATEMADALRALPSAGEAEESELDLGDGSDTVRSQPPTFTRAPLAERAELPSPGDKEQAPPAAAPASQDQGSAVDADHDAPVALPERSPWKVAIGLLAVALVVLLAMVGWFATQKKARIVATLEVVGDCEAPVGEVEASAHDGGVRFRTQEGEPMVVIERRGNRYWVASGRRDSLASAELLSGTGPGRIRVRALGPDAPIDIRFARATLMSDGSRCTLSGEIHSQ